MRETIRCIALIVAGGLFAAACVQGQTSRALAAQVQGNDFVARKLANGRTGQVYLFGGAAHTVCLDGGSGQVIWSVKAPGLSQQASPGAGPVLAGRTLVYMGNGGFFTAYALDAETGKTKWSLEKRSVALAAEPSAVFLGTDGGLGVMAINAQTGKIKWEHRVARVGGSVTKMVYAGGRLYTDSPWVWNATTGQIETKLDIDPSVATASDGRVFMVGSSIPLVALDAQTSKILWKQRNPLPSPHEHADDFLAASDRYVAAAFYDGDSFEMHRGVLKVYEAPTGRLLWTKAISSAMGLLPHPVSADDQFVYLLKPATEKGVNATLTAFDGKTGHQAWSFSARRLNGPVAPVGNVILISSDEGNAPEYTTLYALDQKTGVLRWKFSF